MTLKEAVEITAGCVIDYLDSVAIEETFRGRVVWKGLVDVYELRNQPPKFVYGWTIAGKGSEPHHVTVLGGGDIDSPIAAVRAWIGSQTKE
jgi:hypothetical protein